ncbi:hypothetical protein ACWKWP_04460 [Agromyces soli]
MTPPELAERLLTGLRLRDDRMLRTLLAADARLTVDARGDGDGDGDGHGRGTGHGTEVRGPADIVVALLARLAGPAGTALSIGAANGGPAIVQRDPDGTVTAVLCFDGEGAIDALWLSTAPARLDHWNRRGDRHRSRRHPV